jgi:hypothetical protein
MKNKPKFLYVLTTPQVLRSALGGMFASKIGVAKKLENRIGDYQTAFGPVLEIEFSAPWSGPEDEINKLEDMVLNHFEHRVCANVRALSEWVNGAEPRELADCVDHLIQERNLAVIRLT